MTVVLGTACLTPPLAAAQPGVDALTWRATLYGWIPDVSGQTNFSTGAGGPSIGLSPSDYLDMLQMVFMGSLDVRGPGRWGALTDFIYLKFGESKSATRGFALGPDGGVPAGVTLDANMDLKGWSWTLAAMYSLSRSPSYESNLLLGARMLKVKQTLDWTFNGNIGTIGLPSRSGRSEADGTNWDLLVGAKGNLAISADRRWYVPYYFDIGAGDSRLTWQALVGVGYSFGWGAVTAAWRYLDYELKDDPKIESVTFSGPGIGVTFRW